MADAEARSVERRPPVTAGLTLRTILQERREASVAAMLVLVFVLLSIASPFFLTERNLPVPGWRDAPQDVLPDWHA